MAMTYKECEKLFSETIENLSTSRNTWTRLLKTMSNTYKYDFEEQILIYAQRPNAVACAGFDDWSKKLHHTINKGVKGIALFDKSTATQKYPKLRYVYDTSMVSPKANYKRPYIWYVDEKSENVVNQQLLSKYKLKGRQLDENIIELIQKEVRKIDYGELKKAYNLSGGTMIGDLDFDTFCVPVKRFIEESLQYITLNRCGFDTSIYFNDDNFNVLYSLDRKDIILAVGNLINKKANEILCEIEFVVKQERRKQYEQSRKVQDNQWNEKLSVRGEYDILSDNNARRGEWVGLHAGRGNIHISAEPYSGRTNGISLGQMGQNEIELSGQTKSRTISDNVERGNTIPSLRGDRESSYSDERENSQSVNRTTRSERGTERQGLDDISAKADNDTPTSRRNSEERPNLRITEENKKTATEEQSKVAVSVSESEKVNQIIGNAEYRYIPKKRYRKVESSLTDNIVTKLNEHNIKFSGNMVDGKTTFTVSQKDIDTLDNIIRGINSTFINNDFSDNTYEQIPLLSDESTESIVDEKQVEINQFINMCLMVGTGFEDGKYRVQKYFSKNHTKSELAEFLKNECGWGGSSCKEYRIEREPKGLTLQKPNPDNLRENILQVQLSWIQATKYIQKLVDKDEYFTEQDKQNRIEQATYRYKNYINSTNNEDIIYFQRAKDVFDEYGLEYPTFEDVVVVDNTENIKEDFVNEKSDNNLEQNSADNSTLIGQEPTQLNLSINENYQIKDDSLGVGSDADRYSKNIKAIQTLKQIEVENRQATADEQNILAQYVGWGGLDKYFIDNAELKNLLTDDEYSSASASVLNAYYTSPIIIKSMYQALENMGFKGGKILEPSCAVGNFIGLVPDTISSKTKFTGVELDNLSGRIAKQLYPNADIQICGFERSKVKENYFDVAIGNVPFGENRVYDPKYNKRNFLIHDYFFAKSLDLVKPNGVVAFITTKGTLDKKSTKVRKYLAERADLIGAIRLPNNAFSRTGVTSDIIFLQKRENSIQLDDTNTPSWVNISPNADNIVVNNYFVEHPEMILGKMEMVSSRFGKESTCIADNNTNLSDQLDSAVKNLKAEIKTVDIQDEIVDDNANISIPNGLKNDSFFVFENNVYYRENEIVSKIIVEKREPKDKLERIKGLIDIRDAARELLEAQVYDCSDDELFERQTKLNKVYDDFVEKYGRIASDDNKKSFSNDNSYPLLQSLEKFDSNKNFKQKADIFTKRTIKAKKFIDSATNSIDALAISMSNTAKVDLEYIAELTGFTQEKIIADLKNVIYKDPEKQEYVMADEYLSGNIREKLEIAKLHQEHWGGYEENILALEQAMPKPLEAGEISIQIGATWINPQYYQDFMFELLGTPSYKRPQKYDRVSALRHKITVSFSEYTGEFFVDNKSSDSNNINAVNIYGLPEKSAYHIFEDCLNLRQSKIYRIIYEDGKEKRVINRDKTEIANQKQDTIKEKFKDWIFKDKARRDDIVETYNKKFNSIRAREYDGKYLEFVGMNPEINLMEHQKNAIAHALYGANTLLAHCVGAGKTFEMIAIAMEGKRLGLHNKSLFCVPNHITEQVGKDFLFLYPNANILVAKAEDFTAQNRKKLCSKIATNDYDAVIIGHSQIEKKISLSVEKQQQFIENQLTELEINIRESTDKFTIRQLEGAKKNLERKLKELIESPNFDDVVTFEELGIDKLFIDEAHEFKNLRLATKMSNVSGIQTNDTVQKTMNLYMICQYLDSITNGKGIVFATGTPISNSMCEIYNMQKYLQNDLLHKYGIHNFDAWAANFGEVVTKLQLAPEGNTYRPKTSFSKFHNIPELMSIFKECADIKTTDSLNLPVPECEIINVTAQPSETQKELMQSLSERADKIRDKKIAKEVDNMPKITTDGRKIGLDARIINPDLPDFESSKVNKCVENVYNIWNDTQEEKSTQLIFCDFSTPNPKSFNVYDDVKAKLIAKGIPSDEIAFIHDAKSEKEKEIIFGKVRSGKIRVLIGSTKKMGAGTNVQERLIASHDLDAPYRPADLEQRKGRMVRQGNMNNKVKLYRYVTVDTFDAYLFQMLENKQRPISQIMTSKTPMRDCDDIDEVTLSYAEAKALCISNPLIAEKMNLDVEVSKLKMLRTQYLNEHYRIEDIYFSIPKKIERLKNNLLNLKNDKQMIDNLPKVYDEKGKEKAFTGLTINGTTYMDKEKSGEELRKACINACSLGINKKTNIGSYKGFKLSVYFDAFSKLYMLELSNNCTLTIEIGESNIGNITRLDNVIASLQTRIQNIQDEIVSQESQLSDIKEQLDKPFQKEKEYKTKLSRLKELEKLLDCSGQHDTAGNLDKGNQEQDNNFQNQQNDIEDNLEGVVTNGYKRNVEKKQRRNKRYVQ